ncbi:TolB family protein [Nonomuraea sp. NPDC003727]
MSLSTLLLAATLALTGADVKLPGADVTLREQPGDPKRVTAFTTAGSAYLRTGGSFAWQRSYNDLSVSPGGGFVAAVPRKFAKGYDRIAIVNRATGRTTKIRTVKAPMVAGSPYWSPDGRKVVLTVSKGDDTGGGWRSVGFVVVDVAARRARVVKVRDAYHDALFQWSPDGRRVVSDYWDGVRFYLTDGRVAWTLWRTGGLVGGESAFSPDGRRMATWCPKRYKAVLCTWNPYNGKIDKKVKVRAVASYGWWDREHLIAVGRQGRGYLGVVVDLKGKVVRPLAEIGRSAWRDQDVYLSYTRD